MERLKLKYDDAIRALSTLKEALEQPYSVYIRDASIQRFECTFEALWKYLKEYLKEKEGIQANSPKTVFREIGNVFSFSEDMVVQCLEMTDRRNDTSHTYKEAVAEIIFKKIPAFLI